MTQLAKNDPRDIDVGNLRMTTKGVVAMGNFTKQQWENAVAYLDHANQSVNWCVGDLLLLGEPKFGEEWVQQRIDDLAPSISADVKLKCQWVASKFEYNRRSTPVPWSHYREASGLEEPEERQRLLKLAAEKAWNQSDLRKAVRAYKLALTAAANPLPDSKYRVLYVDPPWKYADELIDGYGAAEHHYPTMTIDELCALPIKDLAAKDAVLFMWVTSPMLIDCAKVIEAWGFKYKASFVWDKVKHNYGHYNSVRHEFLLICTRGSCTPDSKELADSVVEVERGDTHSRKPEEFRELIDAMYPDGRRIELFAREVTDGWDVWGNEASAGQTAPGNVTDMRAAA